jgi:ADP-ribose pyrophosphatase YjhB (NUDIX family)
MKIGSRVIILKDDKILFIHRIKLNKDYYVLPGGAIEIDESPEAAAIREIKEETNFDIIIDSLLWHFEENVNGELREGYYFLAKEFKGKLKLGGPEVKRQSKDNKYLFEWIPLNKLNDFLMYPEGLKERILKRFFK